MGDITSKKLIVLKGILFFTAGTLSVVYILLLTRSLLIAMILCVGIWSFCRFYYFLFHVLEAYVGLEGRYAGITDLFLRLMKKRSPPTEIKSTKYGASANHGKSV